MSRYGEIIEAEVKHNITSLLHVCTGCCFAGECEADGPREFSRYCDNMIMAACRGDSSFEQPTQLWDTGIPSPSKADIATDSYLKWVDKGKGKTNA